jgi:hypothetical protein
MGVQINGSEGNVIATKGTYSGNVTIGGTLTYEDVTNIDSVGLVTARTGIEIGARPGVAASISIDGNAIFSGITTIATLRATTGIVTAFQGDVVIEDKIIHSGDTNTAIRFPAADTITAETAGGGFDNATERLRIDSSGNMGLGIGGAISDARFRIKGANNTTSSFNDGLMVTSNNETVYKKYSWMGIEAQGGIIFSEATSSLGETMRIDSNGYLVKASGLTAAFNVKGSNMTRSNANAYVCTFDDDSSSGCFDSGNNFNTSTYKFVAPVSGYYYFFTNIRLDAFSTGYIRTAILSTSYNTNVTYRNFPSTGHVINYYQTPDNVTVCQTSTVMYLPATHEAWVYQDPSADTSYTVYLSESSFGGYFIG